MQDAVETLPVVNIIGERVALGPLRRDLLPDYQRWLNDFALAPMLGNAVPLTVEQTVAWYERQATGDAVVFTLYERAMWRAIGTTTLYDIHHQYGRAGFGITIGEAASRGQGYGTEATRLVLDWAFTVLGLHNVMLTVNAYNVAGLRAYEKAGFREFGRRRECRPHDGQRWDMVYMDCLASEFRRPTTD